MCQCLVENFPMHLVKCAGIKACNAAFHNRSDAFVLRREIPLCGLCGHNMLFTLCTVSACHASCGDKCKPPRGHSDRRIASYTRRDRRGEKSFDRGGAYLCGGACGIACAASQTYCHCGKPPQRLMGAELRRYSEKTGPNDKKTLPFARYYF